MQAEAAHKPVDSSGMGCPTTASAKLASAKLEYNYIDFGTRSFNASIGTNAGFAGRPTLLLFPESQSADLDHRE